MFWLRNKENIFFSVTHSYLEACYLANNMDPDQSLLHPFEVFASMIKSILKYIRIL